MAVYWVALTERGRSGGAKVGARRRDVRVELEPGDCYSRPDRIADEAMRITGLSADQILIFGVWGGGE